MQVKYLKQTKPTNCGQTVVAMLFNITIEAAEQLIGHDGITTEAEIASLLTKHGLIPYEDGNTSVWLQLHKNPRNSKQKHWTLLVNGDIIDPSGRKAEDLWPVEKFWILNY
jgi:hypothetical protein